jgi:hypothetical protein
MLYIIYLLRLTTAYVYVCILWDNYSKSLLPAYHHVPLQSVKLQLLLLKPLDYRHLLRNVYNIYFSFAPHLVYFYVWRLWDNYSNSLLPAFHYIILPSLKLPLLLLKTLDYRHLLRNVYIIYLYYIIYIFPSPHILRIFMFGDCGIIIKKISTSCFSLYNLTESKVAAPPVENS